MHGQIFSSTANTIHMDFCSFVPEVTWPETIREDQNDPRYHPAPKCLPGHRLGAFGFTPAVTIITSGQTWS